MNGNMSSFLTQERQLVVRLGKEDRDAHEAKHGDSTCIQYGAVMRDQVVVPESVIANKRQTKALFAKSIAFAATLKAKATRAKKATSKASPKKKGKTKGQAAIGACLALPLPKPSASKFSA